MPIAWKNEIIPQDKNAIGEDEGTKSTAHLISWNGGSYKREKFFAAAYGEKYNKIKKRVRFKGKAADDVLMLSSGQRTRLMYNILAAEYGLEKVDEQDSADLVHLCELEKDNKTADDLLFRLRWDDGLAKLVTFGVGMKLSAPAEHTWCYSVEFGSNKAVYWGEFMDWEFWQIKLKSILDSCRTSRASYKELWERLRPTLYYQNGRRLTLAGEDYKAICDWVRDYLADDSAPFPLHGEIPAAAYSFVIDYKTDVEFVANRDLKGSTEMAAYNSEVNKEKNAEKSRARIEKRFA